MTGKYYHHYKTLFFIAKCVFAGDLDNQSVQNYINQLFQTDDVFTPISLKTIEASHSLLTEEINSRIDALNSIAQFFESHEFQFANRCDV